MKSSPIWFENVSTYEHLELEYFSSEYNWSDAQILNFLLVTTE